MGVGAALGRNAGGSVRQVGWYNRRDVVRSDEETGPMFVSFGEVNNSNSTINKSEKNSIPC